MLFNVMATIGFWVVANFFMILILIVIGTAVQCEVKINRALQKLKMGLGLRRDALLMMT